ncbi:hypothetical protein ONZ45_g17726 [Pleurotus djamor]|nr:hypothetical protein ONZ45_g17726 [Pleurotus djamor]
MFPGDLTIGSILEGYENITSQPKLKVTDVPIWEVGDQHFQLLLDKDGIIGPNGQAVKVKTAVDETKDKRQVTAVIDTGFSLSQVPKSVADAFYSGFAGAEFRNVSGVGNTWIVPCKEEVNITFKFSNTRYRVHPLDALLEPSLIGIQSIKNANGDDCCIGAFQPVLFNLGSSPNFDMILGMSFLRNVYALIDYGDFIADSKGKADPYIQFLSTTEPSEAHSDFVHVRLNGVDTTTDRTLSSNQLDDSSDDSRNSRRTLYYIIAGVLLGVAVLIIIAALIFNHVRQKRARQHTYQFLAGQNTDVVFAAPPMQQQYNPDAQYDPYQNQNPTQYQSQPGQPPLPPPQYSQQQPYNPPNQYSSPWDHRY